MPQQQPERSNSPTAPRRPDFTMSLLTDVMEHSLDDGYAEAAARKGVAGTSRFPAALSARLWLALGLILAALVVTLGAAQAQVSAPTEAKERQKLIDRVQTETHRADALQKNVDGLRDTVSAAQRAALPGRGDDAAAALVGILSCATPVTGPGVQLVVDDAKEASHSATGGPRQSSGFSDTGRVRDRDMQRVVNGLWASGAEAVSVNGERLTSLSAIRAAGDAILVDNKPLAPPYTVLAIGDGKSLSSAFLSSADGQYLQVLKQDYGIRASISVRDSLHLAAAPSLIVRYAQPAGAGQAQQQGGSHSGTPGNAIPGGAGNGKVSK